MLATSHTAKLADGNSIHYTDSGAVPHSTNYTTLVMLHGSAFSSHIFCKLYSLVEQQNLRIVTVQRRDYPGSTPYTDEELDDLRNGRKSFLDRLGILLAHFLEYLIREHNVPKTSMDRSSGGFSILGWSMGTATAMSLLSDPTIIPRDTYLLLEQYVTNLVLYDPPYLAFGYELPPNADVYDPWTDPIAKTPEERYLAFKGWVGSYYTVPEGWSGNIRELDMSSRTDRCTLDSWTPDQFQSCYHQEAAVRSEIHMCVPAGPAKPSN
ncbi:hypothetical protein BD779DRAFT_1435527 [Infundibulicybe gibba]|nr:hypothetical protein BD779DRAFT_1435527 [Infundibulicybe gibba]